MYTELAQELNDLGVHMGALRINQTPSDCTFCILDYGNGQIEVFFFERGQKYELRSFTDAPTAIKHFKDLVLSTPHINREPVRHVRT